jgi:hypothetical protein
VIRNYQVDGFIKKGVIIWLDTAKQNVGFAGGKA